MQERGVDKIRKTVKQTVSIRKCKSDIYDDVTVSRFVTVPDKAVILNSNPQTRDIHFKILVPMFFFALF